MLIIDNPADEEFLITLAQILAGWSARAISGDERNDLARQLTEVLNRAHASRQASPCG